MNENRKMRLGTILRKGGGVIKENDRRNGFH
jgi:hypothetical protein